MTTISARSFAPVMSGPSPTEAASAFRDDVQFSLQQAPIDSIEALWRELDRVGDHSFFLTWTWIGTWLSALPPEFVPHLLTATRGQNVVGAAILISRQTKRHGLIGTSQFHLNSTGERFLDCVTIEKNGFAGVQPSWRALARWFAMQSQGVDELVIPGVEHAAPENEGLLFTRDEVPAFRRHLPQLAERGGLEATLSRNARQKLRRSMRDFSAVGELRIEEAASVETALDYFKALEDLHVRSWTRRRKPHAFRFPFFGQFHRALIARGIADRSVQLLRVNAGSRAIGYLYNFRHRGRIYAYQSGFEDSDPVMRPGYVCHALAIDLNARQGAQEYDFLAGDNRLKRTFGPERYVMSWCSLRRRTFKLRAEMAARSMIRRIAARP